jgi:hypothetical protein
VSLDVGSLIRLQGVKVFDEAKPPPSDTGMPCPYRCLLNLLAFALLVAFLPGAKINIQSTPAASNWHFYLQKYKLFGNISTDP